MFDALKNKVNKLKQLNTQKGRNEVLKSVFDDEDVKEFVIGLNTDGDDVGQLYFFGIDSTGDKLLPYAKRTVEIKKLEGLPFDRTTLFHEGDFYKTFVVKVFKNHFTINANPIKIDEDGEKSNLFENYGEDILGLTDDSKEELVDFILDEIIKEVKKVL